MDIESIKQTCMRVYTSFLELSPLYVVAILVIGTVCQFVFPPLAPALWTLAIATTASSLVMKLITWLRSQWAAEIQLKCLSVLSKLPKIQLIFFIAALALSFLNIFCGMAVAAILGLINGIVMRPTIYLKQQRDDQNGFIPGTPAMQAATNFG